ncbi:MAG: branched-chain amino acid ABC transporter permease [Deltaproteobacteria bacterium]|nr:branched-chain amino acid ABC transporter permease [Deltaproteobacteria bacterium]
MDLIESYTEELKLIRRPWTKIWIAAFVLAVILLPLYMPEHVVYLATVIAIWAIGVQGQNLLIGYTGQISFGQAGFLAIGAFTFGHLAGIGLPWPLSLIGAGILSGLFGLLVGFPSLRLKGPYLAIATLGFGIAVYQILLNFEVLSGGRMGMTIQKIAPLFGLSGANTCFTMNLLIAIFFTLVSYNIVSSYMGRAFIAIRDNDIAAEVLGVNLTHYKLMSFAVSSFYVGVQGGLYALFLGFLEPNMFSFEKTIDYLVAIIVGGLASVEGAIFGAAFIILIPQIFSEYREMVPVVYGLTIILILIFEPLGIAGRLLKIRLSLSNWPFR